MLTDCTCSTGVEAKLDVEDNKVVCMECGAEIKVTDFTKTSMKMRHDIIDRRDLVLPPNGLLMTCDSVKCNKPFSAELDEKTDEVNCPFCKTKVSINFISKNMLRQHGIFIGATKRFADQEGKEAISIEEDELSTGGNAEEKPLSAIFDSIPIAPQSEIAKEVIDKSLNTAPSFKRVS